MRADASERGRLGRRNDRFTAKCLREHERADETACAALDVTFDTRDLSCEEDAGTRLQLHPLVQQLGRIDERISVHASEPEDLRLFETGNHAEYTRLLAVRHARL